MQDMEKPAKQMHVEEIQVVLSYVDKEMDVGYSMVLQALWLLTANITQVLLQLTNI